MWNRLIALMFTLPVLAMAGPEVSFKLDTSKEFPLNMDAFGFNNNLVHRPFHWSQPDFVARYVELGRPFIRYPGGTTANYLNVLTGQVTTKWKGKVIDRTVGLDKALRERWGAKGKELTPFTDLVKKTGARWTFVVNLCTMTPEENRKVFLRMKQLGVAPNRIELGNEVYYGSYKPFIHNYPKQARDVAQIAREIFPNAKLGVVVPESYYTHEVFLQEGVPTSKDFKIKWINEIRKHTFYDAIIIHLYTTMGIHRKTKLKDMPPFPIACRNGLSHMDKMLDKALGMYNKTFPGKEIWVTEYSMAQFSSNDVRKYQCPRSFMGGLVGISMMPRFFAHREVTMTTFHSFIQFFKWSGNVTPETKFEMSNKFEAFKLLSEAFRANKTYVPVTIQGGKTYTGSGKYKGRYPELDAHFFRNGDTGRLYIYNKFETPYQIGEIATGAGKGQIVSAKQYMPSVELPLEKAKVDMKKYTIKTVAGPKALVLPPYSLSFITVRLADE